MKIEDLSLKELQERIDIRNRAYHMACTCVERLKDGDPEKYKAAVALREKARARVHELMQRDAFLRMQAETRCHQELG